MATEFRDLVKYVIDKEIPDNEKILSLSDDIFSRTESSCFRDKRFVKKTIIISWTEENK